jgi:hypothetical protein
MLNLLVHHVTGRLGKLNGREVRCSLLPLQADNRKSWNGMWKVDGDAGVHFVVIL